MEQMLEKEVKLYMIFDTLGDIERTGPLLWDINRKRTEDIKNHTLDLIFIIRILRKYLPSDLDYELMYDYAMVHDLPETITGDITDFEGISKEQKKEVNNKAINWFIENFNNVIDFKKYFNEIENKVNIEAKIVHMIDKIQSAIVFIKYQLENNVNMNNPKVPSSLRNHPYVIKKINEGKDLGDIFFEFHMKTVNITDEECQKYTISREKADLITNVIKSFAYTIYKNKQSKNLLIDKNIFPIEATIYDRNDPNNP